MARALQGLPKLAEWAGFTGYRSSMPKEEGGNYLSKGSENVMITGNGKLQAFKGMLKVLGKLGGIVMMNVAETDDAYASLGAATGAPPDTEAWGNVFNVYACLFFIGYGWLRLQGEDMLVQAEPILQVLVKIDGGYTDPESGPWQAGLPQPSAPFIEAVPPSAELTGKVNGVVSVVIWRIRSSTGAISIQSEVSNIIACAAPNQSVRIHFLSLSEGQDAWGIGVTKHGEGAVGSHFELMEVYDTEVGVDRVMDIEWRDGDLVGKQLAPIHDFPPPEGYFAGAVEDVVFVDGCYAEDKDPSTPDSSIGSAIAPSEPGKPESFSPDSAIFTNDMPTALIRGDGLYWRFGRNSCYVVRYLGGEKPLSVEIAWEGLGIEYQHNACVGEGGRLYLWPNERGPMRLSELGAPDGSFATDIADDLAPLTEPKKRVVGWDAKEQVVAYCYGKRIWPWFAALGRWGSPLNLEGMLASEIRSCVPEGNILHICDWNDNLYRFNKGAGSVMKVRTGWAIANGGMDTVALVAASVRADNTSPVTIETFADGDDVAPVSSIQTSPKRPGFQTLPSVWPNVTECESHAMQVTIASTSANGDVGVESITTYGDAHSMLR